MERLEYDLLFRWFVGIGVDDAAWDQTVLRRTATGCWRRHGAAMFLSAVLAQPKVKRLLSSGALLRRRHPHRGLGVDEELQAEEGLGRATARWGR